MRWVRHGLEETAHVVLLLFALRVACVENHFVQQDIEGVGTPEILKSQIHLFLEALVDYFLHHADLCRGNRCFIVVVHFVCPCLRCNFPK